jgi:hypothetical protein
MKSAECLDSELIQSTDLNEEMTSLKKSINKVVEDAVNSVQLREDYFLVLHAKFDPLDPSVFVISQLIASLRIPPFCSNTMVFFVSPTKGFIELMWMVAAKEKGKKLKVEFNKKGVAYLQAKGAMPS